MQPQQHSIDGPALVAALHREVASLRASAVAQRALAEAARTAQLHGLVADAEKLVSVYDDAAARLLNVIDAAVTRRSEPGRGPAASSPSPQPARSQPARFDLVAELLQGARRSGVSEAAVAHSLKIARARTATPQQRYAAVAALIRDVDLKTVVLAEDRVAVVSELRAFYDDAAAKLPSLDDCFVTVEEMRQLLRGGVEIGAPEAAVRRDDALKRCLELLRQLSNVRASASTPDPGAAQVFRDLAAMTRGTLQSLAYPGGKAQQLAELTIAELGRLADDFDVAAVLS